MHPILFWYDGRPYATYSLFLILGCVAGVLGGRALLKDQKLAPGEFWGIALGGVGGGLVGGKLGYFFVERARFLQDPAGMLADWSTGWVFWPAILLALLASWGPQWWRDRGRRRRRAFLPAADCGAVGIAIGQAVGRIGCLMEGCCYGRPTTLPWGLAFTSPAASVEPELRGIPLHPTQLYEIAGDAAAAAVLIGWVLPRIRAGRWRYGTAFFGYLLFYSVLRFAVEFLRGDDRGAFLWPILSPSQWVSLFVGLAAATALWRRGVREHDPRGRSLFVGPKASRGPESRRR